MALGYTMCPPGHVSNKTCSSKFPERSDGFCWSAACNHNKNHKGQPSRNISPSGESIYGDLLQVTGAEEVPQAFLADSITISSLGPTQQSLSKLLAYLVGRTKKICFLFSNISPYFTPFCFASVFPWTQFPHWRLLWESTGEGWYTLNRTLCQSNS